MYLSFSHKQKLILYTHTVYTHTYMYTHIVHTYMYTHMYTHMYMYMYTDIVYTYMYTHTCTHTLYTHTCTCTCNTHTVHSIYIHVHVLELGTKVQRLEPLLVCCTFEINLWSFAVTPNLMFAHVYFYNLNVWLMMCVCFMKVEAVLLAALSYFSVQWCLIWTETLIGTKLVLVIKQ